MSREYPYISQDKLMGLLERLFKCRGGDKIYDLADKIDDIPHISLGFSLESCSFADRRVPISSGVRHLQKPFRDYIAPFVEDAATGIVIVSDAYSPGVDSLYAVTAGERDAVRNVARRWWDSAMQGDSYINIIVGERPSISAAAVQLKSLL